MERRRGCIKQGLKREVRVETGASLSTYIQYTVMPPFMAKIINIYIYVPLLILNVTVFKQFYFRANQPGIQ